VAGCGFSGTVFLKGGVTDSRDEDAYSDPCAGSVGFGVWRWFGQGCACHYGCGTGRHDCSDDRFFLRVLVGNDDVV
jgi:hypothetical protein